MTGRSEAAQIYRAILTQSDPARDAVFQTVEEVTDVISLLENSGGCRVRPVLLFDDRTRFVGESGLRRWQPTLQVVSTVSGYPKPVPGYVLVLTDDAFPADVRAFPDDLVRLPEPGSRLAHLGMAWGDLLREAGRFASGCQNLRAQGVEPEKIAEHGQIRAWAESLHKNGVALSAIFRDGVTVPVSLLPPPSGARQLAPALWLERNARVPQGPPEVKPLDGAIKRPVPRRRAPESGLGA